MRKLCVHCDWVMIIIIHKLKRFIRGDVCSMPSGQYVWLKNMLPLELQNMCLNSANK